MADNTTLNPGAAGDTIASDDIAGVKYQRVKIVLGADGVNSGDVASGNAMPVSGTVTANAGTNLNTSALALEAGGNLAAVAAVEGATADVAVTGDNTGTVSAKLRGLNKLFADVWDSVNHWLKVSIQNTSLAVTQSGSWIISAGSALIGKVGIDQTTPGTTNAVSVAQIGATTVDSNSGAKSAGTIRVVIATDQPQLTAKLLVTPDSVALPANQSVNVAQMNGVAVSMGAGAVGTGVQRATLASDDPAVAVLGATSGAAVITDVNGTIQQYLRGIIKLAITAAGWLVSLVPATSGGLSVFHLESAGTTNATNVKASAGQLYGYYIYNSNAAARKVAFHNTSGTPTAGASIFFTVVIPPTSAANCSFEMGIAFGTGIGITTVTGLADSNASAVAADDLNINLFYK